MYLIVAAIRYLYTFIIFVSIYLLRQIPCIIILKHISLRDNLSVLKFEFQVYQKTI